MPTKPSHSADRFPTTGPDSLDFERYHFVTTGSDEGIIFDADDDAWIHGDSVVSLSERC